jgi:Cof subfamily protein (haloacid dehalogenase superfamily)
MYRMIAIDLDGTLLAADGSVSQRTKSAIRAALDAGLLICFATGRNWPESRAILDAVEHYDKAVFVGGAMVIDTGKEVTLHRTLVESELAREVCELMESLGQAALALEDAPGRGAEYLVTADIPLNEATRHWMRVTESSVRHIASLGRYEHPHTMRIGMVDKTEPARLVMNALQAKFGQRILCQMINAPAYGVDVMEVFDPAVNKWEGILHVARHHGVLPAQIIAVGDDINDLPMIRNAGLGVAMGNARPEVQAAAKKTIGPNTADGLAVFLEELVAMKLVEPADRPASPGGT